MVGYYQITLPSVWKRNIFGNTVSIPAPVDISCSVNNFVEVRAGLTRALYQLIPDVNPDFVIFREMYGDWTAGFRVEYSFKPVVLDSLQDTFKVGNTCLKDEELRIHTMFEVTDIKWIVKR